MINSVETLILEIINLVVLMWYCSLPISFSNCNVKWSFEYYFTQ